MRVLSRITLVTLLVISFSISIYAQEATWEDLYQQASILSQEGTYSEAAKVTKEALKIAENKFGPEHPNVRTILFLLAEIYKAQGKHDEAANLRKQASGITVKDSWNIKKQYLPEYFSDLYLGMPYEEFLFIKGKLKKHLADLMSFRFELEERINRNGIRDVIYYFGKTDTKPLYELIIEYEKNFDLQKYLLQKYGNPNHGNEWRFDNGEGVIIMIWTFRNKLVIAGAIKGTEWYHSSKISTLPLNHDERDITDVVILDHRPEKDYSEADYQGRDVNIEEIEKFVVEVLPLVIVGLAVAIGLNKKYSQKSNS